MYGTIYKTWKEKESFWKVDEDLIYLKMYGFWQLLFNLTQINFELDLVI